MSERIARFPSSFSSRCGHCSCSARTRNDRPGHLTGSHPTLLVGSTELSLRFAMRSSAPTTLDCAASCFASGIGTCPSLAASWMTWSRSSFLSSSHCWSDGRATDRSLPTFTEHFPGDSMTPPNAWLRVTGRSTAAQSPTRTQTELTRTDEFTLLLQELAQRLSVFDRNLLLWHVRDEQVTF